MRTALALAIIATAATTYAQVDPDRVVAKVNGTPVTGREYYKRMEVQPGMSATLNGRLVQMYPGYLTMRWIIEEELIMQLAKSQNVAPSQKQIDDEFNGRMAENPEQFKALVQFGFTEGDIKRNINVELSEFNVLTRGITITDFEVDKYYKDNAQKFTLPKRYTLRIIRVANEAGKKPVEDALARGEKFADVAAKLSVDLSRLDGGRIGTFPEEDMAPSTRTIVAATRKGSVTAWIEQNGNFAKFLVEDVKEAELLPLDAKLKKGIRESMMRDRGQARNNFPLLMAEFRKKAVLEFTGFPFAEDLKRHFQSGG